MNRREFLSRLWPFGVTAIIPVNVAPITFNDRGTYGYISADDPLTRHFKVYLNGEDVSWQAYEADDREGFVGIFNAKKVGNNCTRIEFPVQRRRIYGQVRIVPGDD